MAHGYFYGLITGTLQGTFWKILDTILCMILVFPYILDFVIKKGEWIWPPARSNALVEVQSKLHEIELGDTDVAVWNAKNGEYKCADTWEKLREAHSVVRWWKLVWFPTSIPQHSFLLWLMFWDALVTKQRMCGWGYTRCSLCLFCYGAQESREHLFFRCSFSSRIWTKIMAECSILNAPLDWDAIEDWGLKTLQGSNIRANLGRLWLGLLYIIFGNRRMLFCITLHLEQKNLLWIIFDGKFIQGW
jgi:hypothetical protein